MSLRNVTDPPAFVVLLGGDAEELELAPGTVRETKQRLDERRLSGPVRANDRGELAGADGEVDVTQNDGVFVAECRCAQLDERRSQGQGNPALMLARFDSITCR
jgi:hypothetical protein